MEYAHRLKPLGDELADQFFMAMRVYFEKPRTTVGWKGLINASRKDDSFHIKEGLCLARRLLVGLNDLGLPCGTEALDPTHRSILGDMIAWSTIGARTPRARPTGRWPAACLQRSASRTVPMAIWKSR